MPVSPLPTVNELWAVLPNPRAAEDVTPDTASSLPSSSSRRRSQRHQAGCKDQDTQSASTMALAGSILSEGQDASYRLACGHGAGMLPPCPLAWL